MKIKDLVAVNVDTAYSLFPIDSERYELVVAVRDIVATPLGAAEVVIRHSDSRIEEFLSQVYKNFYLGAEAAGKVYYSQDANVSAITLDRARRCEASYSAWFWHNSGGSGSSNSQFQDDFNHLWLEFLLQLLNEPEAVRIKWTSDSLELTPADRVSLSPRINNVPKR